MHEKKHNPEYKPPVGQFKCDICGKTYVKHGGLKVHMRKHTGVKPYCCDVCGKSVSSRAILEVHLRTHTGEKPNICEICGKMFSSKRYLDTHIRSHTGERPFNCNICGKSFTQQSTLIVHHRYHTGSRPYKCPVCEKAFVLRTQLKSHQKGANHYYSESQSQSQSETEEVPVAHSPKNTELVEVSENMIGDDVSIQEVVSYDDLQLPERILISCQSCNKTFRSKHDLLDHQRNQCYLSDQTIKSEPPSDSE